MIATGQGFATTGAVDAGTKAPAYGTVFNSGAAAAAAESAASHLAVTISVLTKSAGVLLGMWR